jgi:hypothetical protein
MRRSRLRKYLGSCARTRPTTKKTRFRDPIMHNKLGTTSTGHFLRDADFLPPRGVGTRRTRNLSAQRNPAKRLFWKRATCPPQTHRFPPVSLRSGTNLLHSSESPTAPRGARRAERAARSAGPTKKRIRLSMGRIRGECEPRRREAPPPLVNIFPRFLRSAVCQSRVSRRREAPPGRRLLLGDFCSATSAGPKFVGFPPKWRVGRTSR